jgi:hypothetical protein
VRSSRKLSSMLGVEGRKLCRLLVMLFEVSKARL